MDIRKVKKLIELLEAIRHRGNRNHRGRRIRSHQPLSAAASACRCSRRIRCRLPRRCTGAGSRSCAAETAPALRRRPTVTRCSHRWLAPSTRRRHPDAQPFVKVGDEVKVGDTLCIIEAMKMMNQIDAEVAGKIVSIEVENAEPVEFGQTSVRHSLSRGPAGAF